MKDLGTIHNMETPLEALKQSIFASIEAFVRIRTYSSDLSFQSIDGGTPDPHKETGMLAEDLKSTREDVRKLREDMQRLTTEVRMLGTNFRSVFRIGKGYDCSLDAEPLEGDDTDSSKTACLKTSKDRHTTVESAHTIELPEAEAEAASITRSPASHFDENDVTLYVDPGDLDLPQSFAVSRTSSDPPFNCQPELSNPPPTGESEPLPDDNMQSDDSSSPRLDLPWADSGAHGSLDVSIQPSTQVSNDDLPEASRTESPLRIDVNYVLLSQASDIADTTCQDNDHSTSGDTSTESARPLAFSCLEPDTLPALSTTNLSSLPPLSPLTPLALSTINLSSLPPLSPLTPTQSPPPTDDGIEEQTLGTSRFASEPCTDTNLDIDMLPEPQMRFATAEYPTFLSTLDKAVDPRVFQLINAKFSISPMPGSQCGSEVNGEGSNETIDLDGDRNEVEVKVHDDQLPSLDTNSLTPDLTERSNSSPLSSSIPANPISIPDSEELPPVILSRTQTPMLQGFNSRTSPDIPLHTLSRSFGKRWPYACPNARAGCRRSFKTKRQLDTHVRYGCCILGTKGISKNSRRSTRTTRTSNRPQAKSTGPSSRGFPCSVCGRFISRKYNLRKHLQRAHGLTGGTSQDQAYPLAPTAPESSHPARASAAVRIGENSSWASTQSGGSKRIKLELIEAAELEASLSERTLENERPVAAQEDGMQWPEKTGDLNTPFFKWQVGCDKCLRWFHYRCAGIKKGDRRLKKGVRFLCVFCEKETESSRANNGVARISCKQNENQEDHGSLCLRPDCDWPHEAEYVLEHILGRYTAELGYVFGSREPSRYLWLVKWGGYPPSASSWIPNEDLPDPVKMPKRWLRTARRKGLDLEGLGPHLLPEAKDLDIPLPFLPAHE